MVLEQIYFTKLQAPDLKHPRNSNVLPSAHVRRTPHHQAGMHSCDAASASTTFACIRRYLHHFARCQTISGTRARNTLHSLDSTMVTGWTRSHTRVSRAGMHNAYTRRFLCALDPTGTAAAAGERLHEFWRHVSL